MSKAEKFIIDSTKNYSNEKRITVGKISNWVKQPWLTPDEARKAVEIAREEMIEKALISFQVLCNRPAKLFPNCENYCNVCKQFKQTLKDG